MKCVTITLTDASVNTGNFDLYSNADPDWPNVALMTPFETGISRAQLLGGYDSTLVPDTATQIMVKSNAGCVNSVNLSIVGLTPTPSPSSSLAATPSPTRTPSETPSPTPTRTPSETPSPTPTRTPSPTPTRTPSNSALLPLTQYCYEARYICNDSVHCNPPNSCNCGSITYEDEYGSVIIIDDIAVENYPTGLSVWSSVPPYARTGVNTVSCP